jgi:hypothetical protein
MSGRRQKNRPEQEVLAFPADRRSDAPMATVKKTETLVAKRKSESLAGTERLMEEVCALENCKQALHRVKANKGSRGVDGMTVDELPDYLQQHGLEIGEQLRNGTYQPQPVRRAEIPKTDGHGVRKLGIPCVLTRRSPNTATVSDRGAVRGKRYTRRSTTSPKDTAGWWTSTWKILRSSKPRPSVSGGGRARGRQANAQVDSSIPGGRCDGGWIGESGG